MSECIVCGKEFSNPAGAAKCLNNHASAASELEELENISAEEIAKICQTLRFMIASQLQGKQMGKKRISFLFPLSAFKSIFGVCADMRKASGGYKLELFGDDIEEVLTALIGNEEPRWSTTTTENGVNHYVAFTGVGREYKFTLALKPKYLKDFVDGHLTISSQNFLHLSFSSVK